MKLTPVRLALPLLMMAVVACGRGDHGGKADAGGEVLPGSVSDAMIPFDTVRSQPPLGPDTSSPAPSRSGVADRHRHSDAGPGPAPLERSKAPPSPAPTYDEPLEAPSPDTPQ